MTERTGILAAGNWVIDRVKIIDQYPQQDQLARILDQTVANGGSPYNVLKDLARLGASFELSAAGLVGDDPDGEYVLADCAAHHIDVTQLRRTREAATSYTDVMSVRSTGRRTFFHHTGANRLFAASDLDLGASNARILHVGHLLLLDALDEIGADGESVASKLFSRARARGIKTSADLVSERSERFVPVVAPSLPHLDYLFLNEFEAEQLTGIQTSASLDSLAHTAKALIGGGVREMVFVHSPEGAVAGSTGWQVRQASVRLSPEKIAGAVGAGDALAAGILLGLHEGWDIATTLRLGVCAAAASLLHATSSEGVLSWQQCLELGATFGFRSS